jgi:hypothetical protein
VPRADVPAFVGRPERENRERAGEN